MEKLLYVQDPAAEVKDAYQKAFESMMVMANTPENYLTSKEIISYYSQLSCNFLSINGLYDKGEVDSTLSFDTKDSIIYVRNFILTKLLQFIEFKKGNLLIDRIFPNSINFGVDMEDGKITTEIFHSYSISDMCISSFVSMMLTLKLLATSFKRCANEKCNIIFYSDMEKQKYCSKSCGVNTRQRVLYQNKRRQS